MLPLPPLLLPLRPMLLLRLHGLDVRRQLPAARGETSSGDASAASIVLATTDTTSFPSGMQFFLVCVFLGQV